MNILILGGYGVFGGRLAECLSDLDDLHLIVAGRSGGKARAFCQAYTGKPEMTALKLDRACAAEALARLKPDLVVDATGPFQTYGDDPYALPRAAIAAGIPYLDFADGAAFVEGIAALDAEARAAGVFALSGVSSFPVLTAAVVREIGAGMTVRRISAGIAPSPFAGIGLNVMRAVVGYAGEPVTLTRGGQEVAVPGLVESRRVTIAPPGRLPLRNTRFSLVDVPDLRVLPRAHPGLRDVWVGAGPVPEVLHRALNLLARLRAWRLLPNLGRFAPLYYAVLNRARFGEHRGGMFVEVEGDGGQRRCWHLLAEGDDGPMIPSMAIEILVRKMLAGDRPAPGARPATDALTLADYEAAFARRSIFAAARTGRGGPLYARVLDSAFDRLPAPVRALHDLSDTARWSGRAEIERAPGWRAVLAGAVLGLPRAGRDVPVTVTFTRRGDAELWERDFGGRVLRSIQRPGRGRSAHLIDERFGPFQVSLACVLIGDKLHIVPRRWSLLEIPMPRRFLPGGRTFETADAKGRFHFDVQFTTPLTGDIARYSGWLTPGDADAG